MSSGSRLYIVFAGVVAACSGGSAPEIHGLSDQVATVGTELIVLIDGTDADGDRVTYGVDTDISLQGNASISQDPSGKGVFRWTPLAEDVGTHAFDFTISDSSETTTVSISIEVRSALGAVPIFRQPLGAGTAANPAACVMVDILVEDQDSPQVTILEEEPKISGAQFMEIDGTSASWRWCPTPTQVAMQDRYTLELSADDGDNPKTLKHYVLVLNSARPRIVINEVDYDQIGSDTAEYIELFNPSATPVSLAGLHVVLVNGATSIAYDSVDLSSIGTLDPGAYLVIAGGNVAIAGGALHLDPVWSQDEIQNGMPDGIALIDGVTHTLIDAFSYEGAITDASLDGFPGPMSLVEGAALPVTVLDSSSVTRSMCRLPNGSDTNDTATDWGACGTLTPGAANVP